MIPILSVLSRQLDHDGDCQVWWATHDQAALMDHGFLSADERGRCKRYKQIIDRDRFVVGAAMVRMLLASQLDIAPRDLFIDRTCQWCGKPHGRPVVPGSDVRISVSHAGRWVAVACGRVAELGIDVEQVTSKLDVGALVSFVLSPSETISTPTELIKYWTRKEAILKATGDGLTVPMRDLTVTAPMHPPALLSFRGRPDLPKRTKLAALSGPQRAVAVLAAMDPDPDSVIVTEHRLVRSDTAGHWRGRPVGVHT